MGAVDWVRECFVLGAGILLIRHRASALERRQIGEAGKERQQAVWRGTQGFRDAN